MLGRKQLWGNSGRACSLGTQAGRVPQKRGVKSPRVWHWGVPMSVGSFVLGHIQGLQQGASPAAGSARQPEVPAAGAPSWHGFSTRRNWGLVFSLLPPLCETVTPHGWIESWAGFCTWCEVCLQSVLLSLLIPEGLSGSCFGLLGQASRKAQIPKPWKCKRV